MENIGYYLLALLILVLGFITVKKVTTCMIKAVVGGIVLIVLAVLYWIYFK